MGDFVAAVGRAVRTGQLQIASLLGEIDHALAAETFTNFSVAFRPEQLKLIIADFIHADGHGAAVAPFFALSRIGSGDQRGTIKDVLLSAFSLTVGADYLGQCPLCGCFCSVAHHKPSLLSCTGEPVVDGTFDPYRTRSVVETIGQVLHLFKLEFTGIIDSDTSKKAALTRVDDGCSAGLGR